MTNSKPVNRTSLQFIALCLLCIMLLSSFISSYYYMNVKNLYDKFKKAIGLDNK